jgi:hypothetical protein
VGYLGTDEGGRGAIFVCPLIVLLEWGREFARGFACGSGRFPV